MVRVRLLGLVVVLRRPGGVARVRGVARVPGVARVRRYPGWCTLARVRGSGGWRGYPGWRGVAGQRVSLLTAWRTTIARPASSLATGTRNGEHET